MHASLISRGRKEKRQNLKVLRGIAKKISPTTAGSSCPNPVASAAPAIPSGIGTIST